MLSKIRRIASRAGNRLLPIGTGSYLTVNSLSKDEIDFKEIWNVCQPYTMTSLARGLAVFRSVRYLVENSIEGDIIECGVWRGGSSMIAMLTLMKLNAANRKFILFDTYSGMTEPSAHDLDLRGTSAAKLMTTSTKQPDGMWCIASLDEVRMNIATTRYPAHLVEYVAGDIRETLLKFEPQCLSLLRLDTDFYDSTKLEMELLYPHLRKNGVLIIDDYGHWEGARKAVDEYLGLKRTSGEAAPMLQIIDYTGRIAIKP